ncbi:MAG: STM4014 family protein [Cystobacter sp.]
MDKPPFLLIGNPENRRVSLFQQALASQGLPPAQVVPWLELLRGPAVLEDLPDTERLVRIDSAGENFEVHKALLALGHEDAVALGCAVLPPEELSALPEDRGRILCPRQYHLGFLRILKRLEALFAARPRWRVLSSPASIAQLFDKRLTSREYATRGIPVPPVLEGVSDVESLRARMREEGWSEVFVKLSCGSSASCLGIYRLNRSDESLFTTIEQTDTGWYNTLNVHRERDPARVEAAVTFLLREGSQVERAMPKARLRGDYFDCRVLTVGGEPAFTVLRQSRHPITNLHLGGKRGDMEHFLSEVPPRELEAAMETCRQVARVHDCLHVGIDLMYDEFFAGHRVLEANAFGDLLPNLRRDGLSVYEWEIREALR